MKKHSMGKIIVLLLLMLVCTGGCANSGSRITIVGSSAMQLLAEQAGNDYRLMHADSNIVVQGGGSGTGLSQVQAGLYKLVHQMYLLNRKKGLMQVRLEITKLPWWELFQL